MRGGGGGGRVTLCVRRAWCGHALGEDREGGGGGGCCAQLVRRMFFLPLCAGSASGCAELSGCWLRSHQIKKSLPHQSFTACL